MDPYKRTAAGSFTSASKAPYATPIIHFAPPTHPPTTFVGGNSGLLVGAGSIKRDASIYREAAGRGGAPSAVPLLEHYNYNMDARPRQDSLGLNYALGGRRESASFMYGNAVGGAVAGMLPGKSVDSGAGLVSGNQCRFHKAWTALSILQMVFGFLALFANLYTHYPIFSCGWSLVEGEDALWFGTWIGVLNIVCGACGSAASKSGLPFTWHKLLRRCYFILNCSFVLFANGIGVAASGITLARYRPICNQSAQEHFTLVMAFLILCLLTVAALLNVIGVVYQVLASIKCKCWVCHPRNQNYRGYIRTT
ncbi:uncharacterized protein LOC129585929 [Paramacrobiotus metropolitanus]|uniref:uncharacterized protein LOC129585929 n=1 Tax=Paramacrobiotus metropolitanus TaxID=2943436 RepID=UPI0024457E5C|nr:uncharacterized protein LOC129585929 [Paramacrobiotus metropolitanus]